MVFCNIIHIFLLTSPRFGEVLEWLKRHAWKACIPLKGIESSNLFLSAQQKTTNLQQNN